MNRQLIISIGREFGSGGHELAERLAKHYNIPLYDREIFDHIAEKEGISAEDARNLDEQPLYPIFTPVAMEGKYFSIQQTVASYVFDFIRTKGNQEKESFVIVGRCAEDVLQDNPNLVSIFVLGDREEKQRRIMEKYDMDEKAAIGRMKKVDKMRKTYHNFYAKGKWGDSRTYDLCINSSTLGMDKTLEALVAYIDKALEK